MTFFREFLLFSRANKPEVLERDKQVWRTSGLPFGEGRLLSKADEGAAANFKEYPEEFEFDEDEDLGDVGD